VPTILPASAVSVVEDEGDGGTAGRLLSKSALPLGRSALLLGFAQSPLVLPLNFRIVLDISLFI